MIRVGISNVQMRITRGNHPSCARARQTDIHSLTLTQRYLTDINVGMPFNAIDGGKRHYVGAGFVIHP